MSQEDRVLSLLDELCRVRAYRVDKDGLGERAIATLSSPTSCALFRGSRP